ncbi:MAG: hypothetical protein LBL07_20510 [Tannerella sp.]|jgi:hypothetical protein|nr:hypothetical protein [Tannerella sp.]
MKQLIPAILFLYACNISLPAQTMKITFLTPEPVRIGDRERFKGDSFLPSEEITWKTPDQVMKAFDTQTNKIRVITASLMKTAGKKTVMDYLTGTKRMSVRSGKLLNQVELSSFFNRSIGVLERFAVEAFLPVDQEHFYYVNYEYEGELVNKKLPVNGQSIVIDRSIFTIDGVRKEPFNVNLKLYYYDAATEQSRLLAEYLMLNVVSGKSCRDFMAAYSKSGLDTEALNDLVAEYLAVHNPEIYFQPEDIESFVLELMF